MVKKWTAAQRWFCLRKKTPLDLYSAKFSAYITTVICGYLLARCWPFFLACASCDHRMAACLTWRGTYSLLWLQSWVAMIYHHAKHDMQDLSCTWVFSLYTCFGGFRVNMAICCCFSAHLVTIRAEKKSRIEKYSQSDSALWGENLPLGNVQVQVKPFGSANIWRPCTSRRFPLARSPTPLRVWTLPAGPAAAKPPTPERSPEDCETWAQPRAAAAGPWLARSPVAGV